MDTKFLFDTVVIFTIQITIIIIVIIIIIIVIIILLLLLLLLLLSRVPDNTYDKCVYYFLSVYY